jgi:hypothetical protein
VGPRVSLGDMEKGTFLIVPGLELRPFGRPLRSQSIAVPTVLSRPCSIMKTIAMFLHVIPNSMLDLRSKGKAFTVTVCGGL